MSWAIPLMKLEHDSSDEHAKTIVLLKFEAAAAYTSSEVANSLNVLDSSAALSAGRSITVAGIKPCDSSGRLLELGISP